MLPKLWFPCLLSSVFLPGANAPTAVIEDCPSPCVADADFADTGLWDISWVDEYSGTGTDPYCETCTPCTASFKFIYTGTGYWRWRYGIQGGTGTGFAELQFGMYNECDGEPTQIKLYDENSALSIALLYCPCQY
jgi:hypothetical protein